MIKIYIVCTAAYLTPIDQSASRSREHWRAGDKGSYVVLAMKLKQFCGVVKEQAFQGSPVTNHDENDFIYTLFIRPGLLFEYENKH